MKVLLIAFIVFLTFSTQDVQAQTKEDTEQWIKTTMEQFDTKKNGYNLNVSFSDGNINIEYFQELSYAMKIITISVPIKSIASANFYKVNGSKNALDITITANKIEKITKVKYKPEYSTEDTHDVTSESIHQFRVTKAQDSENYDERLTTAFNHLIELYGGEIKSDTF